MIMKPKYILSDINTDEIFVKNLIQLIENYHSQKANVYQNISNLSFNETLSNEITINNSHTNVEKMLSNINIEYDDLIIDINALTYQHSSNNEIVVKSNEVSNNPLLDILLKEFKGLEDIYKVCKEYCAFQIERNIPNSNIDKNVLDNELYILNKYSWSRISYTTEIKKILCESASYYSGLRLNKSERVIIGLIIKDLFNMYKDKSDDVKNNMYCIVLCNIQIYAILLNKLESTYTKNIKIFYEKQNFGPIDYRYNPSNDIFQYNPIVMNTIVNRMANDSILFKIMDYFRDYVNNAGRDNTSNNNNTASSSNSTKLKVYLSSTSTQYDKKGLYEKFNGFIHYVNIMSKRHNVNKKVNIYTINVESKIISNSKPNQEYDEYMETKKKLVEEKKTTEDIIKLIGVEPKKNIVTEGVEKEVKTNFVNSKYSAFNNLYLRQEQDKKLYDLVNTFQNDKALMQELGIPNKLGILLHGEPGCGKTTTIITIASYFGRDIFYINLKLIKKNEDLKLVFDYINSKHSGGGIIVLEDIDAMTHVVKKRSEFKEITTTNILETSDNEITLEYMLNLLDGTLTFDDSIVVMTTNHLEHLDPALYRPGRIDKIIEMKKCDHYQISRIFKKFIQRDIHDEVLQNVPEDAFTPAQIIFHLVGWIKRRDESDEKIMSEFIK